MKGFTYKDYKEMLRNLLHEAYTFISYEAASALDMRGNKLVSIYHAIDVDPTLAFPLAEIENELGVEASYHFMVTSSLYNVCSPETIKVTGKLLTRGHRIGLHWDSSSLVSKERQVWILKDSQYIASLDGISRHKPPQGGISGIKYFADSRGRWRYGHPLDSEEFKQGKQLHVCVHPIWYREAEAFSPMHRIMENLNQKIGDLREDTKKTLPEVFREDGMGV